MSGKINNKKRRLSDSTDILCESAINKTSHSRVLCSSGELVTCPVVTPDLLTLTSSGALAPDINNPSEISYSVNTGKKKKPNMPEMADNDTSDIIQCNRPSYDGQLFDAINSETSCEAVALLTLENSFTQDRLNQGLISACRRGHKQLVQTLVRAGANIEHRDEHGSTPLLICAENGFTDIVRFLVYKQANVNAVNSFGNTALILSVRSAGSAHLIRFLLEQEDIDIHHENQHGDTALFKATHFMDVDTMRLLLEKSLRRNTVQGCEDVSVIRKETDFSFYNNKSQEIIQQCTVERTGLRDVYRILQDHLTTQTSPLELAIKAGDTKSLGIFLDCQFSSTKEKKRLTDNALIYIFENRRHKIGEKFSSTDVKIIQKLLQYGADINLCYGPRLISLAVESGNLQLVELLCTNGANLKTGHFIERHPMCIAAENGRQDLIELLLKYKAEVNHCHFNNSALDSALRNDHTECARLLIQNGAQMNVKWALRSAIDNQKPKYIFFLFENYGRQVRDYFSRKPLEARNLLTSAVQNGNIEIIGQILDAGIDINEADSSGQTPLMMSKNGEVAEFLIRRGADVTREIEDKVGIKTAWSHLINQRVLSDASTVELCKVLIDNGAAVNRRSLEDKTPLMIAASREDCVSLLQILLGNGPEVNYKDNKGNTVFMHAVMGLNSKNVTCLIDSTRDKKSLINIQNNEGLTPLILSVQKGNVQIVRELIDKGADLKIKDDNENTALHHLLITCPPNREEILTSLLEAGSHVNCQNSDGLSPLMLAAKKTMASMISPLLDAGADVNAVSKRNTSETALSFLPDFEYNIATDAVLCIETLMSRGASCSYLRHEYFHKLIIADQISVIPKLIQHGLGPADVETHKMDLRVSVCGLHSPVSPLLVALWHSQLHLARYFVDILFLTSSDMSMIGSNSAVVNFLHREGLAYSVNFLQELSPQPMSLVKLCLVRISTAVGSSPGRETRVDSLLLTEVMKDRLLFKSVAGEHTALLEILLKPKTMIEIDTNTLTESDSDDVVDDNYVDESDPSDSSDDDYWNKPPSVY